MEIYKQQSTIEQGEQESGKAARPAQTKPSVNLGQAIPRVGGDSSSLRMPASQGVKSINGLR